jgi:acetylornithine deacetylase/succinyl-diaminopimelate desuccinylase-like protein
MSSENQKRQEVDPSVYNRPVELLQKLVQFDTTNPPGNERACIEYIERLLAAAGLETELYARDPERPNLVARLSGGNEAPALLLQGHVDVVPTTDENWTYPPFDGVVRDGFVWGRGTLDMKGGVTMMLAAVLKAAQEDVDIPGDIVVSMFVDEERGGDYGAGFVVEEHPEVFSHVEYALGEFGGFNLDVLGQRFYPIQLNEKIKCTLNATFHGPAGHGSTANSNGAMSDMARAITAIQQTRLPTHITPTTKRMIEAISAELPPSMANYLDDLLDPEKTDEILDELGETGEMLDSILHNTANPTVVHGGDKVNVIPPNVEVTLDCRLLPGETSDDIKCELREVIPDDVSVDLEVTDYQPFPSGADDDLFDLLASVLSDADSDGTPIPLQLQASTDARHLARVGVQSYGFTPMMLPEDYSFLDSIHASDERIPVDAVGFGTSAIFEVITRYTAE